MVEMGRCSVNTCQKLIVGFWVLCLGGVAIGANGPTIHHGSSTPTHSTHSAPSRATPTHHERRERAWRDWYYRNHHRYIRPGYYYPVGYPPGYNDSDPTPTSSTPGTSTDSSGVSGANNPAPPAASGAPAAPARDPVNAKPDAQPNLAQVDPDLQIELDRIKKACASRPDYIAAVADKNDAEEKLAELHRSDSATLDTTVPLATRAMNAKKQIAAIEREETARAAKLLKSDPQTQPAATPIK